MSKSQKGLAPIIIVLILVAIVGGGILLFLRITSEEAILEFTEPTRSLAVEKARDADRENDLKNIQIGLGWYYNEHGSYPTTLQALNTYFDPSSSGIYNDPKTIKPYQYKVLDNGKDYEICIDFEVKEDRCVRSKTPEVAEDETANWETYRNEDWGFEMRYSEDWQPQGEITINFVQKEGKGIVIISKPDNLNTAISEVKKFISDNPDNVVNFKEEQILLDNVPATKITFKILYLKPMAGPGWQVEIFVNEDKNLKIYCQTTIGEEYISIFDQMLSTFRFLE